MSVGLGQSTVTCTPDRRSSSVNEHLLLVQCDPPKHIDELRQSSGPPVAMVSATLALLELKGLVPYVLAREEREAYQVEGEPISSSG